MGTILRPQLQHGAVGDLDPGGIFLSGTQVLAGFGEQWQKFSEQIDKVDRHLGTLTNSFGELSGTRRRQLERQLDRIDDVRSRSRVADDESPVLGQASLPVLRDITDRSAS